MVKSVLRIYGKYGIRVYLVFLGSFDIFGVRENLRKLVEERGEFFEEIWEREVFLRILFYRMGRWEEFGLLVVFLLSEEVEYMFGFMVVIDGVMMRVVDI